MTRKTKAKVTLLLAILGGIFIDLATLGYRDAKADPMQQSEVEPASEDFTICD